MEAEGRPVGAWNRGLEIDPQFVFFGGFDVAAGGRVRLSAIVTRLLGSHFPNVVDGLPSPVHVLPPHPHVPALLVNRLAVRPLERLRTCRPSS
jgi:hypothetical protein